MNILILGSGGREHSLAWAIAQNPKCDALFVAPGNAGTTTCAQNVALDPLDGDAVAQFCADEAVDFVVVGPEAPLAAGIADRLRASDILTFGPSAAAARLEASKAFTKEICDACDAPTAAYARFTDAAAAKAYVAARPLPTVLKADGLAAGKGVLIPETLEDAEAGIDDILGGSFGDAGAELVIEDFMTGEEASYFILSDGTDILPLGTAQDHKRAFDGDKGPNTGGMGAYSPAPIMTAQVQAKTLTDIVKPTISEMARRGTPFEGVLYVGLMIENDQPRLVEYNVRFGDPECQVLMMRLGAQILDLLLACAQHRLSEVKAGWAEDHALTVVMAANGYPGAYEKGTRINGLATIAGNTDQMVFHAGTSQDNGHVLANGGRVLNVTARAASLAEAQKAAYSLAGQIDWPGGFCRTDIGWRAIGK